MNESAGKTLEEFRRSFSYRSRTDLLFKFLGASGVSDEQAAEFFRGLLELLGEAFDTGDYGPVMDYCFRQQAEGYMPAEGSEPTFQYETTPWTPLARPLSESRVAIISAGGLFVKGNDPLGLDGPTQEEAIPRIQEFLRGPPVLSVIPRRADREEIVVRHPGYDIRGAVRDRNVVFPVDRLIELETEGFVGQVAEEHYSFVGAISQKRLLLEAPAWADRLKAEGVDVVLLVAA